jgi:hydrogenase maturation factor
MSTRLAAADLKLKAMSRRSANHIEVAAMHDWTQVGVGRALAASVDDVHVEG